MKFGRSLIAVAVATLFVTPVVQADDTEKVLTPVKTTADLEAAEVQARTELGRLNEFTPMAGSVLEREEIEAVHFVDSLHELLPRVPGISMSRNLRFTDGGKNYTENRIDGMRARNTGTYGFVDQVNAGDIERIEFIRGPGSVLSGSNAIGGTINVITRDPPAKREYKVTGEAFEDGGYRSGLTGGGRLNDDIGYFFNVNYLDKDGWRDHSEEQKTSLSTKWVWRPDSSSRLAFRLEHIDDDYQSPGTLDEAQFHDDWQQAEPGTFYRTDVKYTTPSLHYRKLFGETGELNLYGQRRYTDQTSRGSGFSSGGSSLGDTDSVESNFQLIYKHNFRFAKTSITGGFDYLDTESRSKKFADLAPNSFSFVRGAVTSDSKTYESNKSPFLQVEFSPLDPLRLTFGVRRDNIEYRINDQLNDNKDGSAEYKKTVRKFGALYELSPKTRIWANIAEGFLGPGVSTLLGSGTPTPATPLAAWNSRYVPTNMDLKPEESLTREIGIRGEFDFGLRYDTGYYETDFKDLIVSQACIKGVDYCRTRNVNAAKATAHGFETSLEYDVNKYLEIGLTHTYARYRYLDYVTSSSDYSGTRRYYTPRNHYNLRFVVKPAERWRVELEGDYIDSYYTNQANTDRYSRPDIYNLRASYHAKAWSAWLHVLNLMDTKYAERVGSTDAAVRESFTDGYTPRLVRVGLSYQF